MKCTLFSSYCKTIYTRCKMQRVLFYISRSISRVLSRTTIYLDPGLPLGSSHLLGTAGPACMSLHGVAPDRVYSVAMSPWDG